MSYMFVCFFVISSVLVFFVIVGSSAASSVTVSCLLFLCLRENIPVACQANDTQRILLRSPDCSSSEVFAVCGVDDAVWGALEVTV